MFLLVSTYDYTSMHACYIVNIRCVIYLLYGKYIYKYITSSRHSNIRAVILYMNELTLDC